MQARPWIQDAWKLRGKQRKSSYAARRQAGPTRTAVMPSTATTAESLAAYLESPLLYSFPSNFQNKSTFGEHVQCQNQYNKLNHLYDIHKKMSTYRLLLDTQVYSSCKSLG